MTQATEDIKAHPIAIKRSKPQPRADISFLILIVLLACGVTIYQGWLLLSGLLLLLLGYVVIAGRRLLEDDNPQLIMNEAGINLRHIGFLPWESLDEIWPEYYRGVCVIVFKLKTGKTVRFQVYNLEMPCGDIRSRIEQQIARVEYEGTKQDRVNRQNGEFAELVD